MVEPSSELEPEDTGFRSTSTVQGPVLPSPPDFALDEEADISDASFSSARPSTVHETDIVRYHPPPAPTVSYSPPSPQPQLETTHDPNLTESESEHGHEPTTENLSPSAYVAFMISAAHFVFKTFTYYTELNSAQHSHTYEEILKKSLVEWYTVGAFVSPLFLLNSLCSNL